MENSIFAYITVGFWFSIIYDVLLSIIDLIREEAWRIRDYERIIYYLVSNNEKVAFDDKDVDNIHCAVSREEKRINKRNKIIWRKEKILSFFKKEE